MYATQSTRSDSDVVEEKSLKPVRLLFLPFLSHHIVIGGLTRCKQRDCPLISCLVSFYPSTCVKACCFASVLHISLHHSWPLRWIY